MKKDDLRSIFRFVLPFTVIILLMSVHGRLDGFLLERIHHHGAYEAGIYASAYRLLDAANMAGYMAASFLVPFIARHQSDRELMLDAITNTKHGLVFFALTLVAFMLIFALWVQQL